MNSFIDGIKKLIKLSYVESCEKCNYTCNSIHFQRNFESWTSGDDNIDKLIQDTQLSAHDDVKKAIEWIPYNRFNNVEKGEFGKAYRASWIDGDIKCWNEENQNWKRENQNIIVNLKSINNSKNITSEFTNKV
jgi:hypothetical protein